MNLNPLYELKERLESSIIAGVSLIPEDFRLARAIKNMEQLAGVSPVFNRILQSAQKLLSDECTNKADVLLDTLALADAVLKTQAVTSVEGEIKPLDVVEGTAYTNIPYSIAAPVLEALNTKGSGHYRIVLDAHEKNPEIFLDYRLKPALVSGLGASYAELASHIEEWLCEADMSLVPLLKKDFDPEGKKEMVRRVHIIEVVAGAAENKWYISMLGQAKKDVRIALIYALRHSVENQELLMGLVKTEKGNSKKAALWAMSRMEGTDNLEFWNEQLKKSPAVASYLTLTVSDSISELVAGEINKQLDRMQEQSGSGINILTVQDYNKIQVLLSSMMGKASNGMLDVYRRLADFKLLEQMRTEKNEYIEFSITSMLTDSLIWSMDERLFILAWELYQEKGVMFLEPALAAALLEKNMEEAYNIFAGLIEHGNNKDKKYKQVIRSVIDVFSSITWNSERQEYEFLKPYYDGAVEEYVFVHRKLCEKPDIRWFELLTDRGNWTDVAVQTCCRPEYGYMDYIIVNEKWYIAIRHLVCPQDKEICAVLGNYFYQRALLDNDSNSYRRYYPLMEKCGFKGGKGIVIKNLEKGKSRFWEMQEMIRISPMPLQDKIKEMEEIKKLKDNGKLQIPGWNNEGYEKLYIYLVEELELKGES